MWVRLTRAFVYILLFFVIITTQALGQKYYASVQHFDHVDGLSNNVISDVVVDGRELVWCATKYGLNRFDGRNFKAFFKEDGLRFNYVDQLIADGDILWCIYQNAISAKYEDFSLFHTIEEREVSFEEYLREKFFEPAEVRHADAFRNHMTFYLKDGRVFIYSTSQGMLELPFARHHEVNGFSKEGHVWVSDTTVKPITLTKYSIEGEVITSSSVPWISSLEFVYANLDLDDGRTLFKYRFGTFWIYEDGTLEMLDYKEIPLDDGREPVHMASTWYEYHEPTQLFWYCRLNTNVLFHLDGRVLLNLGDRVKGSVSIAAFMGNTVFQASDNGLYVIDITKVNFKTLFTEVDNDGFRGICRVGDQLYFNSYYGVFRWNPLKSNEPFKIFPFGLSSAPASDGNLWVSYFKYLAKVDAKTDEVASLPITHGNELWSLYEDKKGKIWGSELGLFAFDPETRTSTEVDYGEHQELKTNTVYQILEKDEDHLLLVTTSGVYEMTVDGTITERYSAEGKGKQYLPSNDFRHMFYDPDIPGYWLAASRKGVVRWNTDTYEAEVFPLDPVETKTLHAVYPGKGNDLWLSSERGIIRFDKDLKRYRVYTSADGLSDNEFNRISHFQDHDSTIYFGSIHGVTAFKPQDFTTWEADNTGGRVMVVDVSQYDAESAQIVNKTPAFFKSGNIELGTNDRFFNIKLGVNSYKFSDKVVYHYQVEGVDNEWSEATSNEILLSNLGYGKQQLLIKAYFPDGNFSENTLRIPILVATPMVLTWWFWTCLVLLVVIFAIAISRYRTRRLNKSKLELELQVKKRTQKIEDDKVVIEKQAEELKELDQVKSKFFTNISHELRTPLTLVLGPLENTLQHWNNEIPEQALDDLKLSATNARSLNTLVNEILDLSKLEARKLKLVTAPMKLHHFVANLIKAVSPLAESKSVKLVLASNIPQETVVLADENKAEKVLRNLLSNAIKFTLPETEVTIRLATNGNDHFTIEVEDSGPGISLEDQEHVFDRFYQAKEGEAQGGTGVGLALSKELAQLMGGDLLVSNGVNGGAIFKFTFKAELASESTVEDPDETLMESEDEIRWEHLESNSASGKRVLVVEDHPDLQNYIFKILSPYFEVITASNGIEALQVLEKQTVDLITSDVMMPGMNGMALLQKLRSNEATRFVPVIMITAVVDDESRFSALEIGVNDYITKPFYARELLARANNLLGFHTARNTEDQNEEEEETPISEDQAFLKKLTQVVMEHLGDQNFGVLDLAEGVHSSERTLLRKLKKINGTTPNGFIKEIRLHEARKKLESGKGNSAAEVASFCGFNSTYYFNTVYTKRFGKRPNEYFG